MNIQKRLVPTDMSKNSEPAKELALALAKESGAKVVNRFCGSGLRIMLRTCVIFSVAIICSAVLTILRSLTNLRKHALLGFHDVLLRFQDPPCLREHPLLPRLDCEDY